MTAVRVQDPLLVTKDGSVVGRAQTMDFVGPGFTVTSSTTDVVTVSIANNTSGSTAVDVQHVWNEIPSGSIDGMNMVFTLVNDPIDKNVMLFHNGKLIIEGVTHDYVLSSSTISMMTAPMIDDTLMSSYIRASKYYEWNETPSGSIDSINRDFYLHYTPISGTLMLFYNGVLTQKEMDYSLTGSHVTVVPSFTTIVGDLMTAFYERTA